MCRPGDLARLLMLVLCLLLPASQGAADVMDRAQIAQLAGSARLRLFALARAMDQATALGQAGPGITRALRGALEQQAYYHEGTPALLGRSLRVSPVLAWDDNINGGYVNDTLDLYGLQFQVNPANLARAGWILGGRVDGSLRWALGEGRTADLTASAELGWSPQHEIGRANAGVQACLRNPVSGWTFADLCASASTAHRDLSDSNAQAVSLRLAHLTGSALAAHELSVEIEERWQNAGRQTGLTLGWGAVWDRAVTELRVGIATPIEGEQATRLQVSARASWMWGTRPVSVSLWHSEASGGRLLGMAREDAQTGIGLSVQARPGLSLDITHQVTRSSIALFDEARTGFGVRFQLGRR